MAAAAMLMLSCGRPQHAHRKPHGMFTDEVRLRTTPVKNQGRSQLCWIYGMLATIETDRIMAGDSVNLSPDYPARMWMAHLARRSFLSGGRERVDMRGMAPMTLALAAEYGMMTYDPYNCGGDANYNVLARRLTAMARRSHSMSSFDSRCTDILDESLGYMPSRFWLYSVEYSPRQLARSLFLPGDYTALTSFTHHSMGDTFALEVPDNKTACRFLNVPVDTLITDLVGQWPDATPDRDTLTDRDHAAWRILSPIQQNAPAPDDHCMALTGMARDRRGRLYFIAKNSWGTDNPYGGMMYLSEEYVRMKTIAVVMRAG